MLVISLKELESVVIDGGIEVKLLEIRGGKIRLGFAAPRHRRILRKELINRKDNCHATSSQESDNPSDS